MPARYYRILLMNTKNLPLVCKSLPGADSSPRTKPRIRSLLAAAAGAWLLAVTVSRADNGSWAVDFDGSWSDSFNWTGDIVADGSGFTAAFANDITGSRSVILDSARTIGNLVFGDADTSTAAGWFLVNGGVPENILTLAGGTPTITVNDLGGGQSAQISLVLAGTEGLVKNGPGTLTLNAANTFTGGITVNQGTLTLTGAGASPNVPTQAVTMNGGTLFMNNAGGGNDKTLSLGALTVNARQNTIISQRASGLNITLAFASVARTPGAVVNYELHDADGIIVDPFSPLGNPVIRASGVTANTSEQGSFVNTPTGVDYQIWNTTGTGIVRRPDYGTTLNFVNAGATLSGVVTDNNQMTSSITGQATAGVRTIKFGTASMVDLGLADDAVLTLGIGGLLRTQGGSTTISGTNASIATDNNIEYVFNAASSVDSLTVNVAITGNGTNHFTKAGDGLLTLGGVNTFIGNTYVTGGTLTLADDAQLKFVIGASGVNNMITGEGILNLDGDFLFDLSAAGTGPTDSWTIVDLGSLASVSFGSTFNVIGFTENAGVWTSGIYRFDEATGLLTIPEPGALGLAIFALGGIVVWTRKLHRIRI